MGMSASQARLLAITARINDVEYKSQQISNTKLRLADEAEQVSTAYTNALNTQKYTFTSYKTGKAVKNDLDSKTLSEAGFSICASDGAKVPGNFTAVQLYEMIESGQFYLQKDGVEVSVSSEPTLAIEYERDNGFLAKAEAGYNAATAKINRKEKLLDNDLKALDTEHSALTTEQDSVKSLIGDNVEKSFNLFS